MLETAPMSLLLIIVFLIGDQSKKEENNKNDHRYTWTDVRKI